MKNKIKAVRYFIFLIILSGLINKSLAIEPNIPISGQLIKTQHIKNSEIEQLFRQNLYNENHITYTKVPRGLIMSIDSMVFFEAGNDEIKENSKYLLDKIGELIKYLDKPCVIEGSAKTNEIKSPFYDTNWEISIIRAEKIAQYLIKIKQIDPQKIRAVGFGEMMPSVQNIRYNNENEQRIDFVILNYEENDW